MKSRTISKRLWAAVVPGLLLLTPYGADAAGKSDGKEAKRPSAGKQLKLALKNLLKKKSFQVSLKVQGGTSDNPQHKITQMTVRETYLGKVYKNRLMHVPSLKAFRTPKKGVKFTRGLWRNILSDRRGVMMDRLFTFPVEALSKAARHAKKATWVEKKVKKKRAKKTRRRSQRKPKDEDLDEDEDEDEGDRDKPRGRTVVKKKKKKKNKTSTPTVVRVEIPPSEALTHFLKVEKSGCIGGG